MPDEPDQSTEWSPHTVTTREYVDPGRVAALSALLDSGLAVPTVGEDLPPLWHWVALPTWPDSSQLDVDGHPRRGGLLPPLAQPRRMFAGGSLVLHAPLRVGEQVRRESIVESVDQKSGRSGDFVVVRVRHLLCGATGDVRIEERQDLVFRDRSPAAETDADLPAAAALEPLGPPLRQRGQEWDVVTDPTLLMRFSAATANPHRIHYDWPYATKVEGYPGLVVQGPLSTLLLAEALRLGEPDTTPARLHHRNMAPLFCAQPAHIVVSADSASRDFTLRDVNDQTLVTLTAETVSA